MSIAFIVLDVVSILYPDHKTFMWGLPGQFDPFPTGPTSKQGGHTLNMRMARTARMRDRPARDSTFMCLNLGGSRQRSASLKKGYQ
jgi:hypothetical protein